MSLNKLNIQVGGFEATASLTIKEHIVDILMMVAGTQDPVNTDPDKHAANTKYWQSNTANLWSELEKLKPQFIDLNLSEKFFSWNGDNNEDERNKAAERLLDLITRLYLKSKEGKTLKFEGKEVHLHLIGHSHGGNVINQFTKLITDSEMLAKSQYDIEELPEKWAIKSITYLSTPFFNDKHQLKHTKLHEDCKIINVRNEYDITQRFIADFSLYNLEYIIQDFNKDEALKAVEKIILILDSNIYAQLFEFFSIINEKEGTLIWERTVLLLENVIIVLEEVIKCISSLKTSNKLVGEKATFVGIIEGLIKAITNIKDEFTTNTINRDGNYGIAEFINDCEPTTSLTYALDLANKLLAIEKDSGAKGSALLNFLAKVFAENTGVTESIDNTSWTPEKQVPDKSKIVYVDITKKDPYDKRGKKSNFDGFAKGIEGALKQGNLQEMLMRLLSQFIEPADLMKAQAGLVAINSQIPIILYKTRKRISLLNTNINRYRLLVKKFNADLIAEKDLTEAEKKRKKEVKESIDSDIVFKEKSIKEFNKAYDEITNRKPKTAVAKQVEAVSTSEELKAKKEGEKEIPGSIAYLATVSHGLSHTFFWKDVKEGLQESFSSGVNKGYKEPKREN